MDVKCELYKVYFPPRGGSHLSSFAGRSSIILMAKIV